MANEYQVHGANLQVLRTPQITNLQIHGASVQVLRTISSVSGSSRRKQVMTGSF